MARPNIALTEKEVIEFLHNGTNLQVATIGRDGYPHLTTLWYGVVDGLIAFRSFRKSQRVANLPRQSRRGLRILAEHVEQLVAVRRRVDKESGDIAVSFKAGPHAGSYSR